MISRPSTVVPSTIEGRHPGGVVVLVYRAGEVLAEDRLDEPFTEATRLAACSRATEVGGTLAAVYGGDDGRLLGVAVPMLPSRRRGF